MQSAYTSNQNGLGAVGPLGPLVATLTPLQSGSRILAVSLHTGPFSRSFFLSVATGGLRSQAERTQYGKG